MIFKSSYLGIDIEVPDVKTDSGGEEVSIIPHDVLEDVILNSEAAIAKNINIHYVCVINEPGHYAFLCSIGDADGRRIEKLGESTGNTLTTDIAKNYPGLMAFKRAFDDAAIKYLGLPGKVYSDQQIPNRDEHGEKTGRSFSAPSVESDPIPGKKTTASGTATGEKPAAEAGAGGSDETRQEETTRTTETGKTNAPKKKTAYAAPPIPSGNDDLVTTESGDETSAHQAHTSAISYTAPPIEQVVNHEAAVGSGASDEFDTTILQCGQTKRQNLSIRAAYALNPGSVRWVAEEMFADNDFKIAQQEACKRFLASIAAEKEEGQ